MPGDKKAANVDKHYHGWFFGRRKAQKLRSHQQYLCDNLLPELLLDPAAPEVGDLAALFGSKFASYRMEIGFGGGEHLVNEAVLHPHTGFIGIEPFINGMAKMLVQIEQQQLQNIRLYDDDATALLGWLPPGSFDRIDLLYSDPWPKKRHWKRRFINQKNLDAIARILKPGGEFRFASDIATYVNWTLNHCHIHPDLHWQASRAGDWHKPWPGWHRTRYEAKAIRQGRQPAYLIFKRSG